MELKSYHFSRLLGTIVTSGWVPANAVVLLGEFQEWRWQDHQLQEVGFSEKH